MRLRSFVLVVLTFLVGCLAVAQERSAQMPILEQQIARLKRAEAELAKLSELLSRGDVVMVRVAVNQPQMPLQASDIKREFATEFLLSEAKKANPDFVRAEKQAAAAATRFLASCKAGSRAKLQALPSEISAVRTKRQKAERALQQLQHPDAATLSKAFGGTWQTDWGKMVLTQTGSRITGTYEHAMGKITGTVGADGELRFAWTQSNGHGIGAFKLSADGRTLSGTWNYTDENGTVGSGGRWSGTRK